MGSRPGAFAAKRKERVGPSKTIPLLAPQASNRRHGAVYTYYTGWPVYKQTDRTYGWRNTASVGIFMPRPMRGKQKKKDRFGERS